MIHAKLAALSKRLQTRDMLVVVLLVGINLYAVWPTLGIVGQVVAVPLALVGAYVWVRLLQLAFALLGRVSARVA